MNSLFNIIFTLIGTIIGAGFISGAEINLFFKRFGNIGNIAILISSILFTYLIYRALTIQETSYRDVLNNKIKNRIIRKILVLIIDYFLLISFFVMVARI